MDEERIRAQVIDIIAVELQVQPHQVQSGLSLRRDLGMDSVAALNIVFAAEETFGIHVVETELENVDDLDGIFALVARHVSSSTPRAAAPRAS